MGCRRNVGRCRTYCSFANFLYINIFRKAVPQNVHIQIYVKSPPNNNSNKICVDNVARLRRKRFHSHPGENVTRWFIAVTHWRQRRVFIKEFQRLINSTKYIMVIRFWNHVEARVFQKVSVFASKIVKVRFVQVTVGRRRHASNLKMIFFHHFRIEFECFPLLFCDVTIIFTVRIIIARSLYNMTKRGEVFDSDFIWSGISHPAYSFHVKQTEKNLAFIICNRRHVKNALKICFATTKLLWAPLGFHLVPPKKLFYLLAAVYQVSFAI